MTVDPFQRATVTSHDTRFDPPDRLLAAHERLREDGFPIFSLLSGHSTLDARAWLGQWARSRGRAVVLAPSVDAHVALSAYRRRASPSSPTTGHPSLAMLGAFREALEGAIAITAADPRIPVVVLSGIEDVVGCLLDPSVPREVVLKALQGLIPVGSTERNVLRAVAEARQTPFFRGAPEGLLYYMLEARRSTQGLFTSNARLPKTIGPGSHEVDLLCESARLVVEIDGREHRNRERAAMDARKQRDLEGQGFRVRRFANATVIDSPTEVWKDIAAQVASSRAQEGSRS